MNYEERDAYGMYKISSAQGAGPDNRQGPGPHLMGADTLIGNDVYNQEGEDLGDIKEIMLDMRSGRVSYAVLSFGGLHTQREQGATRRCARLRQGPMA